MRQGNREEVTQELAMPLCNSRWDMARSPEFVHYKEVTEKGEVLQTRVRDSKFISTLESPFCPSLLL